MNDSNLTERQQDYLQILYLLLPGIRNIERSGTSDAQIGKYLHAMEYDLELIHNIPSLLKKKEYSMSDVHWLKCQADPYLKNSPKQHFGDIISECIERIRAGTAEYELHSK